MPWVIRLLLAAACLAASACATPLALRHATIVDVASGTLRADQDVVVDGDRIVSTGAAPRHAREIDARGLYVVPGLWDMHVHFGEAYDEPGRARFTALLLANGVTGARVMRGNEWQRAYRREVDAGSRLGVDLVIASNFVDGPEPVWPGSLAVADADGARRAVAAEQAAGADFIKVYSLLPREAFFALAEEARARGIPFAGHVPLLVTPVEAASAGMASVEHLTGLLAACSRRQAEAMQRQYEFTLAMARSQAASSERFLALNLAVLDAFDPAREAALLAQLHRLGTVQVPTLAYLHHLVDLADPALAGDPRLGYVPADTRQRWIESSQLRRSRWAPESFAGARRLFDAQLALVGALYRAGVPILAGTDVGNPFLYPGFSLHDELGWLVRAGLPPAAALRAATLDAARFLGRESQLGSVQAGKRADFVLLGSDPLRDIGAVRDVRGVMVRGRWLDRAALDRLLAQARVP